jgi:hypothetical protein
VSHDRDRRLLDLRRRLAEASAQRPSPTKKLAPDLERAIAVLRDHFLAQEAERAVHRSAAVRKRVARATILQLVKKQSA